MLKYLVITFLVSISLFACKYKEAQIIVQPSKVTESSSTVCKAFIDANSIKHFRYNGNIGCGLHLEKILELGIEFPKSDNGKCQVPDVISEILLFDGKKIVREE